MPHYDLVIYGADMKGVTAAKEAASRGWSVAVIDPKAWVGGLNTGGICIMDMGALRTEWGWWKWLCQHVADYYYGGAAPEINGAFRFQPSRMIAAINDLLAGEAIAWIFNAPVESVTRADGLITAIVAGGVEYTAGVIVGDIYEGDFLARAGVTHTYGRESINLYGESLGGIAFVDRVDRSYPVVDAKGNRYRIAQPPYPGVDGQGDTRIQGFNFRMIWSQRPDRLPWQAPPGYRREDFLDVLHEVQTRGLTHIFATDWWINVPIHGDLSGGSSANRPRPQAEGLYGINQRDQYWLSTAWVTGTWAKRDALQAQLYYQLAGTLYFLANDGALSGSAIQANANAWGLPADEYQDEGSYYGQPGWPPVVYVREGRRPLTQYVMSQKDFGTDCDDPVCLANYFVDRHTIMFGAHPDGTSYKEGHRAASAYKSTAIPFRAMKPWPGQADNLILANPIGATSVIWQPIRMEPTFAQLGQVAGMAAHIALTQNKPVGRVTYSELRPLLDAAGAILVRGSEPA